MRWLRRIPPFGLLAVTLMMVGCPITGYEAIGTPSPTPPANPGLDVQAERAAISTLTASSNVHAFFEPGKLVNDGVGIFANDGVVDAILPRRWGRSYPKLVQEAGSLADDMSFVFYSDANRVLTAEATYSVTRTARFTEEFAWHRKLVTKSFQETAQRVAKFKKGSHGWELDSLSPMTLKVSNSSVALQQVRLAYGAKVLALQPGTLVPDDQAPTVIPSQQATVEVSARYSGADTASPSMYVFLSLPPGRDRLRLQDDGHGVYSATFNFPAASGPGHLVIDAVTSATFTDLSANSYDSAICGLSYLVQGGTK